MKKINYLFTEGFAWECVIYWRNQNLIIFHRFRDTSYETPSKDANRPKIIYPTKSRRFPDYPAFSFKGIFKFWTCQACLHDSRSIIKFSKISWEISYCFKKVLRVVYLISFSRYKRFTQIMSEFHHNILYLENWTACLWKKCAWKLILARNRPF